MNKLPINKSPVNKPLIRVLGWSTITLLFVFIMTISTAFALAAEDARYPVITTVHPMNTEKDAPIHLVINATFSKNMDFNTINERSFFLEQRTTPRTGVETSIRLPGTVSYDVATRIATFTPTDPIWPNQHYGNAFTATISSAVKDTMGNSMEHDYFWTFTTGLDPYNKGSSTSEQNETAAFIIPSGTPPATPPVTPAPISTLPTAAAESTWLSFYAIMTYLIILAVVAFLLFLIFGIKNAAPRKRTEPCTIEGSELKEPFGDIHPIDSIEGIGPKYTSLLSKLGILNTQQLWRANKRDVAMSLGLSAKRVQNWQERAELMAVSGIGSQYAELLERSGVHSIKELAASNPEVLLRRVQRKENSLDVNIQGNTPGESIVASWIDAANDHQT